MISIQGGFSISPVSNIASIENPPVGFMISPARHLHFWFSIASFLGWLSICHVWLLDGMWVYWRVFIGIANLRYPAKSWILCWLVDNPIDTKRLVRISLYPSKIDLVNNQSVLTGGRESTTCLQGARLWWAKVGFARQGEIFLGGMAHHKWKPEINGTWTHWNHWNPWNMLELMDLFKLTIDGLV